MSCDIQIMYLYLFSVKVIVAAINRESVRHFFGSKFTTAVLLEYVSSEVDGSVSPIVSSNE